MRACKWICLEDYIIDIFKRYESILGPFQQKWEKLFELWGEVSDELKNGRCWGVLSSLCFSNTKLISLSLSLLHWVFIVAVRLSSCGMLGLVVPRHVDLSTLTRDQTCVCCIGRWIFNNWTPGKSHQAHFEVVTGDGNHRVPLTTYSLRMLSLLLKAQGSRWDYWGHRVL